MANYEDLFGVKGYSECCNQPIILEEADDEYILTCYKCWQITIPNSKTMKTITVDGVTYTETNKTIDDYKIVRTNSAGVFAGYVKEKEGQRYILTNARRLWYWEGAASLSQLAEEGVKYPDKCKFPCEVTQVELFEVIEVLDVTEQAKESISSVPVWKA